MKGYHFITAFKIPDKNNSGFKLRYDNRQILADIGYTDCTYYFKPKRNRLWDEGGFYLSFLKLLFKHKGDVIVMQYPLANSALFNFLLKACKQKGIRLICIVIDIESLRKKVDETIFFKKEVTTFNQFSALIIHNGNMRQWLVDNNCTIPKIEIGLFDYLSKTIDNTASAINIIPPPFNKIAFAGNLQKSKFINKIPFNQQTNFLLYGFLKRAFASSASNVQWMGEYKPEELLTKIQAHWGLIWDGNETEYLDEGMGKYLYYNTPHKTSLYIVCGLPLIVPAKAAIAPYILNNKLGIAINKIEDCFSLSITADEYRILKENVLKVRRKLLEGNYLKSALEQALAII